MSARAVFSREVRVRMRGGGWASSVGLFAVAAGLTPLALGRDPALLAAAAPAILWLTAAMSVLIGFDGLYEDDLKSGGLEVYALTDLPLSAIALIKIAASWGVSCLPLCVLAPALLFAFGLDHVGTGALAFLIGTPSLSLLSGAVGALCAGMRRGTALIVFLCLPLFAPVLVFGPAAASASPAVPLLILGAFGLQALIVCPLVAGAALRAHLE